MSHAKNQIENTRTPPSRAWQILLCAGPGLVVAGSIVGSGELIATTKTGAEAGFSLLWLIVIGCVVKVFAQIEFGRYAILSGKTTLSALDEVPGLRVAGRGNWLVWYWVVMWVASISQLGGIVGGVGQSLAISLPLTQQGRIFNELSDRDTLSRFESYASLRETDAMRARPADSQNIEGRSDSAPADWTQYDRQFPLAGSTQGHRVPRDAAIWAVLVSILTSVVLWVGRYGLIQSLSTVLVASFTLLTIVNLFLLQDQPGFRVTASEFIDGLRGSLPAASGESRPIATALATFGIIGVGAAELVVYPYWCLEKGYGRFVGRDDGSEQWFARASGWLRVMRWDAWGSMVVYTFATVVFYLLGASILHRVGLNPERDHMVRTLAVMFVPVFSHWASAVFLFGAFAVLYSTFFVANASHARTFSDAMRVTGFIPADEATRARWIQWLSGLFPLLCLGVYLAFPAPTKLVLISGVAQGVMLPMLGGAALFFRYRRSHPLFTPSVGWDAMLWLSVAAMLVTGIWTVIEKIAG